MPDLPDVLDRESRKVELDPGAYERLLVRRDRLRQRRRVVAGAVALGVAVLIVLGAFAAARWGTGSVPAEQPITPSNVGGLTSLWRADLGAEAPTPTLSNGMVVTATADGHIVAFSDHCADGGGSCDPSWTAEVDPLWVTQDRVDPSITWWLQGAGEPNGPMLDGALVAAGGVLYTQTRNGQVLAFEAACRSDGGICDPLWTGRARGEPAGGGLPLVGAGHVFAVTSEGTTAFDIGCGVASATCTPSWRSHDVVQRVQDGHVYAVDEDRGLAAELDPGSGREIWAGGPGSCCGNYGVPVRFGDSVYVNFGKELDVFPANCTTEPCRPTWRAELSDRFVDGPVVTDGAVVLTTARNLQTGGLIAFPVDCATGGQTCRTSHRTEVPSELTTRPPVAADGVVYVVSTRLSRMLAFGASCVVAQDGCEPAWGSTPIQPAQPIVAGGVVYVSDETSDVFAWPTSCRDDPCPPLWTSGQTPVGPPAISEGKLFFTDVQGTVRAYAPSTAGPGPVGGGSQTSVPWALPFGAAALIAVVSAAAWRRRRSTRG